MTDERKVIDINAHSEYNRKSVQRFLRENPPKRIRIYTVPDFGMLWIGLLLGMLIGALIGAGGF